MLAPGTIVDGRYAVGPVVGRGGMADVLRADDGRSGEPVALKLLRLHDDGSRARFRTETEVLRVLDHPAVVRLRDAGWHAEPGWHDPVPYLVLDLVEGPTLAGLLGRGALRVDRSLDVGGRLAEALAHAHGHGVVHRDVKPSNVLFAGPGVRHPRLADFGIARVADGTRLTATGACVGTAAYLAPEQLEGAAGPAADVYALGLLLLECITGALCYPGTMAEAALARLHRAPVVPAELPTWLRHTVRAMTDRDPARRPGAVAVARALEECSIAPLLRPTQSIPIVAGVLDLDSEIGDRPGAVDALGHLTAERRRPPARPGHPTRPIHPGHPADSSPGTPPRPPRGVPGHAPHRPSLAGALAALVVLVAVASAVAYLGGDLGATGSDPSEPTGAVAGHPSSPVTTSPPTTAPPPTGAPAPALVAPTDDTPAGSTDSGPGNGNGRANGHGRGQGGPEPDDADDEPGDD